MTGHREHRMFSHRLSKNKKAGKIVSDGYIFDTKNTVTGSNEKVSDVPSSNSSPDNIKCIDLADDDSGKSNLSSENIDTTAQLRQNNLLKGDSKAKTTRLLIKTNSLSQDGVVDYQVSRSQLKSTSTSGPDKGQQKSTAQTAAVLKIQTVHAARVHSSKLMQVADSDSKTSNAAICNWPQLLTSSPAEQNRLIEELPPYNNSYLINGDTWHVYEAIMRLQEYLVKSEIKYSLWFAVLSTYVRGQTREHLDNYLQEAGASPVWHSAASYIFSRLDRQLMKAYVVDQLLTTRPKEGESVEDFCARFRPIEQTVIRNVSGTEFLRLRFASLIHREYHQPLNSILNDGEDMYMTAIARSKEECSLSTVSDDTKKVHKSSNKLTK